jgi:hypothetical protein
MFAAVCELAMMFGFEPARIPYLDCSDVTDSFGLVFFFFCGKVQNSSDLIQPKAEAYIKQKCLTDAIMSLSGLTHGGGQAGGGRLTSQSYVILAK